MSGRNTDLEGKLRTSTWPAGCSLDRHTSKETYNVPKETYNVPKETYDVSKETYSVSKETCNVSKETCNVSKETSSVSGQTAVCHPANPATASSVSQAKCTETRALFRSAFSKVCIQRHYIGNILPH